MLAGLVAPFALEHQRTGWRAWVWLLFFLLAPVAYFAAGSLERQSLSGALHLIPPFRAVHLARDVAQRAGVNTQGWSEITSTTENELQMFADDPRLLAIGAGESRFLPLSVIRIVFYQRAQQQWVLVRLRPDGGLLGVQLSPNLVRAPRAITEEESREIARQQLRDYLSPPASLDLDDAELLPGDSPDTRRFRWQLNLPRFPEAKIVFYADIRGDRLLSARSEHVVDPTALADRESRWSSLVLLVRNFTFVGLVFFAIYRFARRSMEKEVAYARCFILGGFVIVMSVLLAFFSPSVFFSALPPDRLVSSLQLVVVAAGLISAFIQGTVLALSYGGSEGELREIYPGKLTSLDALLTGRPFCANVGRSILFGMAAAGWALLAYVAVQPAFGSRVPRISVPMLSMAYAERGWLGLLLNEPSAAFFLCTLGLLVPLMFVNRFIAQRRLRRAAVVALSLIGASIAGLDFARPWTVWYLVLASLLLLSSFWIGDFLSAVVAINLFGVSHAVLALSSVIGGWLGTALLIIAVSFATAAFALVATYRGRWLGDADVRPKYAERLMERLELQAEVATAREAQLRLLPAELPSVPGFSLAASCTPAREVGGDFYDFFPMSRDRLGILVAEGGSTGLASALSIGLAKGFLLHAASRDWHPGEALRRLRPVLSGAVKGTIERLGLGYAVLDPHAGQFRFARFGQHPRLLELLPGQPPRTIELLGRAEIGFVGERSVSLAPGSTLVLVTDGIDKRLQRRGVANCLEAWLAARPPGASAATLQTDLLQQAGARDADLDDDLTIVILRYDQGIPAVREGVA